MFIMHKMEALLSILLLWTSKLAYAVYEINDANSLASFASKVNNGNSFFWDNCTHYKRYIIQESLQFR